MDKWHFINFKIKWDKKFPVNNFFVDLIIIDLIIYPLLEIFEQNLILWRIHRSATEDGHILRFIFYTSPEIAKDIYESMQRTKFYALVKENYVEEITQQEGSQGVEGAGDGSWPKEINRAWPYYIMGVSTMFLELIKEVKQSITDEVKEGGTEEYYKEIEKKIDELWFKYGCHSFIHHLSAVVGYKPMIAQVRAIDDNSGGVIF